MATSAVSGHTGSDHGCPGLERRFAAGKSYFVGANLLHAQPVNLGCGSERYLYRCIAEVASRETLVGYRFPSHSA